MQSGQVECPSCRRFVRAVPALTQEAQEVQGYCRRLRRLGYFFLIFAGLNFVMGLAGMMMGQAAWSSAAGPFEPWPHLPWLGWTHIGVAAWTLLVVRVILALAASAGLREHAGWGRRVGMLAAAVAMTQFPIGLIFGAYALVSLMGKRSAEMYARCG